VSATPTIERILFTEEQVTARVKEVAREIDAKYAGRAVKLIGVLKGSVFFLTALARAMESPVKIDFLAISSFSGHDHGRPQGMVRIAKDLDEPIQDEDVLLVEDIVDTGFTLRYLLQTLAGRGPNSLAVCTFLDRNSRRIVQVPVEYRCFEIPDHFVIGFGLDHNQLYRNLNYVAVLKRDRGDLKVMRADPLTGTFKCPPNLGACPGASVVE
jgi:hypoxanthine phosphoribosyltransferase